MDNNNTLYQVGDTVYFMDRDWLCHKGIIKEIDLDEKYPISAIFESLDTEPFKFTLDGYFRKTDNCPSLSFRHYDLINGGFTQERPGTRVKRNHYISRNKNYESN